METQIRKVFRTYLREQRENWDEERLRQIASNYEVLSDLLEKEPKAVKAMRRKGLFDELTVNMSRGQRKSYSDEEIEAEARKYTTMPEFSKGSPNYYFAAKRRGMLNNFKNFLTSGLRKYTDDDLRNIASRYSNYLDFVKNEPSVYQTAYNRNLLKDITKNMSKQRNPISLEDAEKILSKYENLADFAKENPIIYNKIRNYEWFEKLKQNLVVQKKWTKEEVANLAKKYETNKEFRDNEPKAWSAAQRNGWIDEIGDHFEKIGSKYKRLIYVYEFPDNHAYVGLTYSEKLRQADHYDLDKAKTAVAKHIKKTNTKPIYKVLSEYINAEEAANLEKCLIDNYRNNGWIMLNTQKGGGLGACKRSELTMEVIQELTKGYKTRGEFKLNHPKEYTIAQKYGWLEDIFAGIPFLNRTKWIYEKTKEEASKYNSRSEFYKGNQSAYNSANKNGWLEEFFPEKYIGHSKKVSSDKKKLP